jgi:hypothetical protein
MTFNTFAGALALLSLSGLAQAGDFLNAGFENGTTSGWTVNGGDRYRLLNSDIEPIQFTPGGSLHQDDGVRGAVIDRSYVDPNLGSLLGSTVYRGDHAYRVEDTGNGGYATAISQKVTHFTESNMFFAWKAVMENGDHTETDAAMMKLILTDDTTGKNVITRSYFAGANDTGTDGRFSSNNTFLYTPEWQLEKLSIDQSLSGHSFTLSLLAADCEASGHAGYAYLDALGGNAVAAVPEPSSYGMMLAGLGVLAYLKRRKKQA